MDHDKIQEQMNQIIGNFRVQTMLNATVLIEEFSKILEAQFDQVRITRDQGSIERALPGLVVSKVTEFMAEAEAEADADDDQVQQLTCKKEFEKLFNLKAKSSKNPDSSVCISELLSDPWQGDKASLPVSTDGTQPRTELEEEEISHIRRAIAVDPIRRLDHLELLEEKAPMSVLDMYLNMNDTMAEPSVKYHGDGDPMQFVAVCEDILQRMNGNPYQLRHRNIRCSFDGLGGTLYDRYWREEYRKKGKGLDRKVVNVLKRVREDLDVRKIEKYQYQFYACKQNGRSVKLYAEEFLKLAKGAGTINFMAEVEICELFYRGLDDRLRMALLPHYRDWVLVELIKNAVAANRFYAYL